MGPSRSCGQNNAPAAMAQNTVAASSGSSTLSRLPKDLEPYRNMALTYRRKGHAEHDSHQTRGSGVFGHECLRAREISQLVLERTLGIPGNLAELGLVGEQALDDRLKKRFLAAKMIVHRALGGICKLSDAVHAGAVIALISKGCRGGLQNEVAFEIQAGFSLCFHGVIQKLHCVVQIVLDGDETETTLCSVRIFLEAATP